MRFSFAAAVAALAAGAVASDAVTETLTTYTTYCPEATSIVHGGSTYSMSTVRFPPCCVVGGCRISRWDGSNRVAIKGRSISTRLSTFHLIPHPPHTYLQSPIISICRAHTNNPHSPAT